MLTDRVYYRDVGGEDGGRAEGVVVMCSVCVVFGVVAGTDVWFSNREGTWTVAGGGGLVTVQSASTQGHSHLES
jgi:hypothetical protein